jgi:predicted DNA-binding antitoxin AbrB/MazE fold protein
METIAAIYKDGVFKPLRPVSLPEGTQVRVEAEIALEDLDEAIRQQLLAAGATTDDAGRIIANFHLLWNSYDTLTKAEKAALEGSRLDEGNFFAKPHP